MVVFPLQPYRPSVAIQDESPPWWLVHALWLAVGEGVVAIPKNTTFGINSYTTVDTCCNCLAISPHAATPPIYKPVTARSTTSAPLPLCQATTQGRYCSEHNWIPTWMLQRIRFLTNLSRTEPCNPFSIHVQRQSPDKPLQLMCLVQLSCPIPGH